MKILAIRGKNLASLAGEFEIDFCKEPLRSAGIFAITGSTGSGKSTLLDAMCIALFNNSPRINNVTDNADIIDVNAQTVKEKDCRNILRRGCSDAYAEVDFKALDGKKYRTHWSVRRSRDKADGKLQDYTYLLYNLTDGYEMPGVKSELLTKVRELIGLTFEQFTRAVLLAQGDFATFLKAPSKNKAEILEKLTGTEVYSKISIKIHEKRKAADAELNIIEEKINDIKLLGEEELSSLNKEKENLAEEEKNAEKAINSNVSKQKWFEREKQLNEELSKAQEELTTCHATLEQALPIQTKLMRIESVQGIRDNYTEILSCKRNIKENSHQMTTHIEQKAKEKEILGIVEKELANIIEEQTVINDKWNTAHPKIRQALRIETELKEIEKRLLVCHEEKDSALKRCNNEKKNLQKFNDEISECEKKLDDILNWFEKQKKYESIIIKTDIIISQISDINEADIQIATKHRLCNDAEELLQQQEQRLVNEKLTAENLNNTLSSEIALLRTRLVEGEPCPVCGSRHHEKIPTSTHTIEEEQLNIAKKSVEENIEFLTKGIENTKNEIAQLKASIKSYTTMRIEQQTRLSALLQPLGTECSSFINNEFASMLKSISDEWNKKLQLENNLNKQLSLARNSHANTTDRYKELENTINEKNKQKEQLEKDIKNKKEELTKLLGTETSAETFEKQLSDSVKHINVKVIKTTEKRNTLLLTLGQHEAIINECKEREIKLNNEFNRLKENIEKFLSKRKDNMKLEELHSLATTSPSEIERMRREMEQYRTNEAKAMATLQERKRNMDEHIKADNRPSDKETPQIIAEKLEILREEYKKRKEHISEIEVILKSDGENRQRYNKYKREYEEKLNTAVNWRKLYELFGSADGSKFKVMAQGYTLDILLGYANKHLKEISQRYELARVSPATLSIKVTDLDMLSESRSVHSLSGGETFLVSLALALALSSLSSNKMSIESLFIDEGFGSLDSETLRVAMEALEKLQNSGRKIGIISHLGEMIERIPAQIKIVKQTSGRSTIVI